MILTGKAKEDFLNYHIGSVISFLLNDIDIEDLPLIVLQSIYIDWLDSVGIYINIKNLYYQSWWSFIVKNCPETYSEVVMVSTRAEAREKAIEKANEMYNEMYNDEIV